MKEYNTELELNDKVRVTNCKTHLERTNFIFPPDLDLTKTYIVVRIIEESHYWIPEIDEKIKNKLIVTILDEKTNACFDLPEELINKI